MHRLVQNLILRIFEGFSGDYLEVPFPTDWHIFHNFRRDEIEVELEFNLPRPNDKRVCGILARHVRHTNELTAFTRNFDYFIKQTYVDFNSRFDLELIRNVVRMALNNNPDLRINPDLANELTQQVTRYYNDREGFARYFTFRDLEEEIQFYFPERVNVDRAATEDYTATIMIRNLETMSIETPHPELVREARRRVEERIRNILLGEEDPHYFLHQSQTLRRIEYERANRINERNAREARHGQRSRRNAPIGPPIAPFPYEHQRMRNAPIGPPIAPFPYEHQRMRDELFLRGPHWNDNQINEIEAENIRLKRQEAVERGEKLLKEHLTEQQRADYEANGFFLVTGCDTGKTYRIEKGSHSNIYLLNKVGEKIQGYCFVPAGNLVTGDVLLTQKIELELNEKQALKVANKFEVYHNMNRTVFGQFTL